MKRATILTAILCLVMVVGMLSFGCNGTTAKLYDYKYPGGAVKPYPHSDWFSPVEKQYITVEKWNSAEHQAALQKAGVEAPK